MLDVLASNKYVGFKAYPKKKSLAVTSFSLLLIVHHKFASFLIKILC